MKDLLSELNKKVRERKPNIDGSNLYAVWKENNSLQIFLRSQGCRFSELGMCTMCDYGISERNLTLHEIAIAMNYIIKEITPEINAIGLGTFGSFFDTYELSEENQNYVLEIVARLNINDITIETFYSTVTEEKLKRTKEILKEKELSIELGLESVSEFVQKDCLNKRIHLPSLLKKIELIHKYDCRVILNVLFGAPFLNLDQQIDDSLKSVKWGFEHGADQIVLFPTNIKPYTLLKELYNGGFYQPISHWGFLMLLNDIPEKYLDKIIFSWYGNRESNYAEKGIEHIMPRACDSCRHNIINFYEAFLETPNSKERKQLLQGMFMKHLMCDCREKEIIKRKRGAIDMGLRQNALESLGKQYHVL